MGRVRDQAAPGVEQRTREVEPLLDVDRGRRVGERDAHLFGDRHEQVVEDLEQHRVRRCADRVRARQFLHAFEHQVVARAERRPPPRFHDRRGIRLADDRGSDDLVARPKVLAREHHGVPLRPRDVDAAVRDRHERTLARRERDRPIGRRLRPADRLDRQRLDDQRPAGHQEAVLPGVAPPELRHDLPARSRWHLDRRVGPFDLEVEAPVTGDARRGDALLLDVAARDALQRAECRLRGGERSVVERRLDRLLPERAHVGEPHAVGGEHARERVDEHARHAERVGDEAGVLAARAAETAERVSGDVVAALDADVLDRVRHVLDRDPQETVGDLHGRAPLARGALDLARESGETLPHDLRIEGLVRARPEHRGKERGIELADHHVAVGHRERSAPSIRRRPRIRTGRLGADAEARSVEAADRAAAGRDRVDPHHRRAQPDARDLRHERAFVLAGVVRDVGRGPAHVEADDPIETGEARNLDGADDAAGRTRQDRVLALEEPRVGEPPRRLHELQPHAPGPTVEIAGDLVDIATQDRRQVGVDDRRVAARHEFHQRRDFVRHRYLGETRAARDRRDGALVLRMAVAVHQDDGDRANSRREGLLQRPLDADFVERPNDLAVRADPLVGFDHALVEEAGKLDLPHEELRPVLVGDAQRVGEALRDHERRALALALEQRIGRDRRAHLDRFDRLGGDRRARVQPEQVADALHRRVPVAFGILGQQLVGRERAVGTAGDDVGERAAAVDPELPASRDVDAGVPTHSDVAARAAWS